MTELNPDCDEYCPILHRCIKYRLEPDEVAKLSLVVDSWEKNKKAMAFFSSIGRMVLKFRGSAYG